MSIDWTKLQLYSGASSNKIWLENSGTFTVAAAPPNSDGHTTITIPHGFGSDNLIWQVSMTGAASDWHVVPYAPGDNSLWLFASLDTSNLYITGTQIDSSGFGRPSYVCSYTYKILVP
jgi:hypothetical protein